MRSIFGVLTLLILSQVSFGGPAISTDNVVTKPVRALHFVLREIPLKTAYNIVDKAYDAGFNLLVIQISDGLDIPHAPWTTGKNAWTRDEFHTWVMYAKNKGLQLVPELQLLTHQEKLFQGNYPTLMFNEKTYNPLNPVIYEKYIFRLMDEIVALVQPNAFHIGHDEVAGWVWRRKILPDVRIGNLPDDQATLPADLFLKDVLKIYNYLKIKGIETWMWGDMLIAPSEFHDMFDQHLHGTIDGYGKRLRDKLPRDIVICDWHYFDDQAEFGSLKVMQEEGFRVIGTTWKKDKTTRNFSRYASQHKAYGMMSSTWFHVQKNEWDIVDNIIKFSGETFKKDFPDAK